MKSKIKEGEISRASNLLTSVGIAPRTTDTFQKLHSKYPKRTQEIGDDLINFQSNSLPLQVTEESLAHCLRECPNSNSPGKDGWWFQHLKLIMEYESTFKLLHEVCNSYLAVDIPNSVAEILSGAKLIALAKTNFDVRPIAIGNSIRRLVSKAACFQLKKSMAEYLYPHQYGVATPGGADMMTHLIQICLQQHPDWVILKLDEKNAFNTMSRQVI